MLSSLIDTALYPKPHSKLVLIPRHTATWLPSTGFSRSSIVLFIIYYILLCNFHLSELEHA